MTHKYDAHKLKIAMKGVGAVLLKVLDDCRVKVMVEYADIQKYGMPYEKINYDDPSSRTFIYELICFIKSQTGLDFMNNRLMVEVISGYSKIYYILITKLEQCDGTDIEFDKADKDDNEVYIYKVLHPSKALRFIEKELNPLSVSLYRYCNEYYLVLMVSPCVVRKDCFVFFLNQLEEFAGKCRYNYVNEAILNEYGEQILEFMVGKE